MPHLQRLNSQPQNLSCMTPKVKMFVHFREISSIPYFLIATDDIMSMGLLHSHILIYQADYKSVPHPGGTFRLHFETVSYKLYSAVCASGV